MNRYVLQFLVLHWGLFLVLLLVSRRSSVEPVLDQLLGSRPGGVLNIVATFAAALLTARTFHRCTGRVLVKSTARSLAWRCVGFTWAIPAAGLLVALPFLSTGKTIWLLRIATMTGIQGLLTVVVILSATYYGLLRLGFWWYADHQE
jgi:hypothetical protein